MSEDSTPADPMHIYNVRARHATDEAGRDMLRAIDQEIDPQPRITPVGMVRRALADGAQ